MSREENVAILDSYYQALKDADFDRYLGLFADDVMYNVNGSTEVSGRWEGKAALAEQLNPHVFDTSTSAVRSWRPSTPSYVPMPSGSWALWKQKERRWTATPTPSATA